MFDNSDCRIHYPDCDSVTKISSSTNKRTGKISFSVHKHQFLCSRHYETHTNQIENNENSSIDPIGDSSMLSKIFFLFSLSHRNSSTAQIETLERELETIQLDNDEQCTLYTSFLSSTRTCMCVRQTSRRNCFALHTRRTCSRQK